MSTIKKLHGAWAEKVLPAGCSQVQRQEMERAFYSGFFACFAWTAEVSASLPETKAEEALTAVESEAKAYFRTLGQAPRDISRS